MRRHIRRTSDMGIDRMDEIGDKSCHQRHLSHPTCFFNNRVYSHQYLMQLMPTPNTIQITCHHHKLAYQFIWSSQHSTASNLPSKHPQPSLELHTVALTYSVTILSPTCNFWSIRVPTRSKQFMFLHKCIYNLPGNLFVVHR
jgi:hypothetical protein